MTHINGDISDLFFNHDHGDIAVMDEHGKCIGYDHDKLRESAVIFIGYLTRLGIAEVPDINTLTADFYGRI